MKKKSICLKNNTSIVIKVSKANSLQIKVNQKNITDSDNRYNMTYDQPCQIDCRVTSCKSYNGNGKCQNISPAITLNENGNFVCWSQSCIKSSLDLEALDEKIDKALAKETTESINKWIKDKKTKFCR